MVGLNFRIHQNMLSDHSEAFSTLHYDFTTLSPEDFEALVADLLSREWHTQLEIFKQGKDDGIDLRNSRVPENEPTTIVQCRRYAPNKLPDLRRSLIQEIHKIERLHPDRYVLVTSVKLSPQNKKSLVTLLHPWCRGPRDIYGPNELNALLRKHEDILRAHFKLWMSSTAVLREILHARIFNITNATIDSVRGELSRLVVHPGLERARAILEQHHHCVIAGNPGIGKTTVARMLMCHYLRLGFKPVVVQGDMSDAWTVIDNRSRATVKHVVLYDDFLGTFRFDEAKFGKNEDASLMNFVERTRQSSALRFILTTRELVLADARRLHGAFDRHADDLAKCTILLEDYAVTNKARVLFNHLYFSDLPESRLALFVSQLIYRNIIRHKHFNPRTVEGICKVANSASLTDEEFCKYVQTQFDDPSQTWEHPFENQIGPVARETLAVLWSFFGAADLETLKEAVFNFSSERTASDLPIKFRSAMKQLIGNFVSCNWYENAVSSRSPVLWVTFQNPSVQEFVEKFLSRESSWTNALAKSVTHFSQVDRLSSWASSSANQPGKADVVSADFFSRLHARAAVAEHRGNGGLYRFVGSDALKFLESDVRNQIQRTFTMLKLAQAAQADDERSAELWSRITSVEGWHALFAEAAEFRSIATTAEKLIDWVWKITDTTRKLCVAEAYSSALEAKLASCETWGSGVQSLTVLDASLETMKMRPSKSYIASLARLTRSAVETTIQSETVRYFLDEDLAALRAIDQRRAPVDPDLIRRVQTKSDELTSKEAVVEKTDLSPTSYTENSEDSNFDIDLVFE